MSLDPSITQADLAAEIKAFLAHADGHDGPAEACTVCQVFRHQIREDRMFLDRKDN